MPLCTSTADTNPLRHWNDKVPNPACALIKNTGALPHALHSFIIMLRLFLFLSLPLYILDQWSKHWIVAHFDLNGRMQEVIKDTFWLHHTANTGVAFGMFNGTEYANYAFGAIALAAMAVITLLYKKGAFPGWMSKTAVALLVAGVCGNFTDRLLHHYVVDFLLFDFGFKPFHPWPSFNVADSCVVVAAILLAIASFTENPKESRAA